MPFVLLEIELPDNFYENKITVVIVCTPCSRFRNDLQQ